MRSILAAVVDCGATGRDVCCAAGGGGFAFTVAAIRRPPAPHAHSDGGTGGEMHLIEKCRYQNTAESFGYYCITTPEVFTEMLYMYHASGRRGRFIFF
jgi:hypothetical protein